MAWLNEEFGPGVATQVPDNTGSAKTTSDVDFSSAQDIFEQYKSARQEEWDWNAKQADLNRQFQIDQNNTAMEYNSVEAQKNREWQEMMSSTAIQRQVADLKAAGINPVLAAKYMGASSGSGSTASISGQSGSMAASGTTSGQLLSLIGNLIQQNTSITSAIIGKEATIGSAKISQSTATIVESMKENFEKWMKINLPSTDQERISSLIYSSIQRYQEKYGVEYNENPVSTVYNIAEAIISKYTSGLDPDSINYKQCEEYASKLKNMIDNIDQLVLHYAPDAISSLITNLNKIMSDPTTAIGEIGSTSLDKAIEALLGNINSFLSSQGKG